MRLMNAFSTLQKPGSDIHWLEDMVVIVLKAEKYLKCSGETQTFKHPFTACRLPGSGRSLARDGCGTADLQRNELFGMMGTAYGAEN